MIESYKNHNKYKYITDSMNLNIAYYYSIIAIIV